MVELARTAGEVDSIGVALPGLFDADGRALLLPNLFGDWRGRAISGPLSAALGRDVHLINDGHAFALAESRLGAGRGADDVMCIVCGTGIGGGLVLGGRLHLGPEQRAGEFGHHTVQEDGPRLRVRQPRLPRALRRRAGDRRRGRDGNVRRGGRAARATATLARRRRSRAPAT